MSNPNRYEIEIRGRATDRVLRPVVDEFAIEPTDRGTTRLVGEIRDPAHLHGLLAHLTSTNVEVVELRCLGPAEPGGTASTSTHPTEQEGTTP